MKSPATNESNCNHERLRDSETHAINTSAAEEVPLSACSTDDLATLSDSTGVSPFPTSCSVTGMNRVEHTASIPSSLGVEVQPTGAFASDIDTASASAASEFGLEPHGSHELSHLGSMLHSHSTITGNNGRTLIVEEASKDDHDASTVLASDEVQEIMDTISAVQNNETLQDRLMFLAETQAPNDLAVEVVNHPFWCSCHTCFKQRLLLVVIAVGNVMIGLVSLRVFPRKPTVSGLVGSVSVGTVLLLLKTFFQMLKQGRPRAAILAGFGSFMTMLVWVAVAS